MLEPKKNQKLTQEQFNLLQENITRIVNLCKSTDKEFIKKEIKALSKATPNPFKVLQDGVFAKLRKELSEPLSSTPRYSDLYMKLVSKQSAPDSQLLSQNQKKLINETLEKTLKKNSASNKSTLLTANNKHMLFINARKDEIKEVKKPPANAVNVKDLCRAAVNGHVEVVEQLIRALGNDPKQINEDDSEGRIPLHLAAQYGHIEVVKRLIGALKGYPEQINQVDTEGMTALHRATQKGHEKVVAALIDELNKKQISNCLQGVTEGKDSKATTTENSITPLHVAVLYGRTSIIEQLLTLSQLNVNALHCGATALHFAAAHGNLSAVVSLLTHSQIDVLVKNKAGQTALECAQGNPAIVAAFKTRETQAVSERSIALSDESSLIPPLCAGGPAAFLPPAEQLPSVSAPSFPPQSSSSQSGHASEQPKKEVGWVAEWRKDLKEKLKKNSQNLTLNNLNLNRRHSLSTPSIGNKKDDKKNEPKNHSPHELENFYKSHYYPMQGNNSWQSSKRIFIYVPQLMVKKLCVKLWDRIECQLKSELG